MNGMEKLNHLKRIAPKTNSKFMWINP